MIQPEVLMQRLQHLVSGTAKTLTVKERECVIATLEAAVPYMLAQGWDEGYKAGLFDKEYYSHNRNPYMLNNEGEK